MTNVEQRVKSIIQEQLGITREINVSDYLTKDLGADSLDLLNILLQVEDEFELEIDDEDAMKWETVQQVIDFIEQESK